jgi:maltose alpha-D-glucosyltransferase/alpha-amylase
MVEKTQIILLEASDPWKSLFRGENLGIVTSVALPVFLPKQRWFGGKSETIRSVHLVDWGGLPGCDAAAVLIEIQYETQSSDTYFFPISLAIGQSSAMLRAEAPSAVLCRVDMGGIPGILYDSTYDEGAGREFLSAMKREARIPTEFGMLQCQSGKSLRHCPDPLHELAFRRSTAEQSNSSIIFGNRLILKLFRRLESGPNPDCEIGRFLTEQAGFDGIPPFGGSIEYAPSKGEAMTIAMLQGLVENRGDGWQWALGELEAYYRSCRFQDCYRDSAVALGRKTAEMHLALTLSSSDAAFSPEPFTAQDVGRLAEGFKHHAALVFGMLESSRSRLPEDLRDSAERVRSLRPRLLDRFEDIGSLNPDWVKIRIHGDYHLGQVLRVGSDYVVLDFEGEPARRIEERRTKQCALKDVAGMLRSFSYAAHTALFASAVRDPEKADVLESCARLWESSVTNSFLESYRAATGGAPILPNQDSVFNKLLDAFLLDKALYELRYELSNRPAWLRIPLQGILSLTRG